MIVKFKFLLPAALASIAVLTSPVRADEGMWTFDNFPSAAVKAKYGFAPDQAWLDHVRGASARLSTGCSSSVVSPNGLVLTNHHCVVACVQNLSTAQQDFVETGFTTKGVAEEKQCKGMQAEILSKIDDVTQRVKDAIAKADQAGAIKARDAEIAAIEDQPSCKSDTVRCSVINLYQGGQYKLYTYRVYPDVRLAFAPEIGTAFFGGDPDNFNFPRYALDSAFVRLYENGKPAKVADYLKFRTDAPKEGDVVFVSGNPGSTKRLYTIKQLEMQRDWVVPVRQTIRSEIRGRLLGYMQQGEEQKRTATDLLFSIENSYKGTVGRWRALMDKDFMAKKQAEEDTLRKKVIGDAKLKKDIGDPWAETDKAMAAYGNIFIPYEFLEERVGFGASSLLTFARNIVRAADERAKPGTERLREYRDSELAVLQRKVTADNPIYPELEQMGIETWLSKTREYLTADHPAVKSMLGKELPEQLAATLVKNTKLTDAKERERLWKGGAEAVNASNDPLIKFIKQTDADARAVRKQYDETVDGPIAKASERIAKARFAVYGDKVYPDATFTLRLSYGAVKGWDYKGTTVKPYTQFSGLYERATGSDPFKLTPRWEKAKSKLTPTTSFDVSTTNDIIGGNSGSPLVDKEGRVVGAAFDGNIHSLGGDYGYDETLNRTVSVTTPAILEALRKVYEVPALADELEGNNTGSIQ